MTGLMQQLGAPGVGLVLAVAIAAVYTATLQFRPNASWYTDLANLRARVVDNSSSSKTFEPRPIPRNLWPYCEVGPRMWRWPLNTPRYVCAVIWSRIAKGQTVTPTGHVRLTRRGLIWSILRLAWYPATGLGALAAIVQALTLMTVITVPVKVLLFVFDTVTVLRGGIPPTALTTTNTLMVGGLDWDQALADLLDTEPADNPNRTQDYGHGIAVGRDGRALDPAQQYQLDQQQRVAERAWIDQDRRRHEALLDRQEQLQRNQENDR